MNGCRFPDMTPPTGYNRGCRCDACTTATRTYQRRYQQQLKEECAAAYLERGVIHALVIQGDA